MDELQTRLQALIAARQHLATVVVREHRGYTADELRQLSDLNGAIEAILSTVHELAPQHGQSGGANSGLSDEYRIIASQTYHSQREAHRMAAQVMADYGRWLIATIAAIHLAGIYLIASIPGGGFEGRESTLWALVAGIVLTMLCGLFAWWNWGTLAVITDQRANANMLVDPSAWPKEEPKLERRLGVSYYASLVLGIASALCIPLAAWLLLGAPWASWLAE